MKLRMLVKMAEARYEDAQIEVCMFMWYVGVHVHMMVYSLFLYQGISGLIPMLGW